MRWYMWYSSVIGQFPKHVRDIRVFIPMQNSTIYDGIKGVSNGVLVGDTSIAEVTYVNCESYGSQLKIS